jgi:site-specific DNA-cytosine methylase
MSGALKMYTGNSNGSNRSYVELFAGCGGMSLGIESVGFKRVFANELSPMAAATYAYNLIHEKAPPSENPEDWFTRL